MKRLNDIVREMAGVFEALRIPYALMGGLAVRIHGLPRATLDIDFTIALYRDDLSTFYGNVANLGYTVSEPQQRGWVDCVQGMGIITVEWPGDSEVIEIDMFLAETGFQLQLLARREFHQAEDFAAWTVTAEDLVLLKLLAGRPKDIVDVSDILLIQGTLDQEYLQHWAAKLQILDRLQASLREFPLA